MNNGLIQAAQPQQQQPQAQQPQPQQQQPGSEEGNQGGQQMYERLMGMALDFIYSEEGVKMVMEGLALPNAQGGPVQNAGNVVAKIIMRLIISAKTAGKAIPAQMLLQAGMELTAAVLEMANEAPDMEDVPPGMVDQVFYAAITIAGKELPDGMLTEQERGEIRQLLTYIEQAKGQGGQQ